MDHTGRQGVSMKEAFVFRFSFRVPAKLPSRSHFDRPVISLDIFATSVAVANVAVPQQHQPEGVNLVPYLGGEKSGDPHPSLFWRTGGGSTWAVRHGDWKLVVGISPPCSFTISSMTSVKPSTSHPTAGTSRSTLSCLSSLESE